MNAYRRWLPIALLLLAVLLLGLYPVAHAQVAAVRAGDRAAAERRYSAALAAYAEAARRCPGCPQPHLRQAAVYAAQGRYEEAWAAFLAAIRVGGLDDGALGALARLHLAQGSPARAAGLLRDLLGRRPDLGEGWLLLGEAYVAEGQHDQARAALETALSRDLSAGQRQVAHARLGLLCLGEENKSSVSHLAEAARGPDLLLGEESAALAAALRPFAGEGNPDDPAFAHLQLGQTLLRRDDLERARGQFEAALQVDSGDEGLRAQAHAYLGHVWSLLGDPEQAEQHLEQAIALAPENSLARYFLGMHYLRRGWHHTGRDVLVAAYELEPDNPALSAAIADSYLRGETPWYEVAEQWLGNAVANAPQDARFHLLLAHLYVDTGLDPGERGVQAAQAAVDLAPNHGEAQETLGWAYHLAGQPRLALEPLERALALAERDVGARARIHYRLGEAYRASGRPTQAREHLQAAVDLDWGGPTGARAREALAGLGEGRP